MTAMRVGKFWLFNEPQHRTLVYFVPNDYIHNHLKTLHGTTAYITFQHQFQKNIKTGCKRNISKMNQTYRLVSQWARVTDYWQ